MPKTARSSRLTPAAIASSEKSEGHPLVMIALFSGIGLLLSLIAIIAAGSDASILPQTAATDPPPHFDGGQFK